MADVFTDLFNMMAGQFGGWLFFAFIIFLLVLVMGYFIFGVELSLMICGLMIFVVGMASTNNPMIVLGLIIMTFIIWNFFRGL